MKVLSVHRQHQDQAVQDLYSACAFECCRVTKQDINTVSFSYTKLTKHSEKSTGLIPFRTMIFFPVVTKKTWLPSS